MTTVQFYKDNNLDPKVKLYLSKSCYAESEDHMVWVSLDRVVDGQDYLVLSRTAATKLQAGEIEFKELCVSHSEQGWGIIMPTNSEVIQTITLW